MSESANKLVHVVDDDASMRRALGRVLNHSGYLVKEYASVGDFLVSDPHDWTGCLLLDLVLGGPSGLELQQVLSRQARALPIVFMSAYGDIPQTVQAMKAGAVDFLVKPIERDALLDALAMAFDLAGAAGAVESASAPGHAVLIAEPSNDAIAYDLGEREKCVLRGIVAGRRNKQIAADLGLSERTIKTCRAGLMRKFGALSLADLVRHAQTLAYAA
ncbi:response regulator transcription factor [Paraburkholderia sp. J67]|uniref:response regulator transcription factor n=1 Tax=Paraburkholderia sp. J67 TaxID=2805435 RepID=UPI002ABDBDB0|nr:response regulator [Paraburkholderia sp. J67]